MRYSKVGQEGSRGSALITLMIIILLVSIAGASMVGFAKQQVYSVTKVRDYLKAQAYAEAGANEAYNTLKTNFALRSDPANFPPRTFGDGGYAVGVQSVSATMASITSTGAIGSVMSVVKMDVKNFGTGEARTVPPTSPYYYGVFVNGYLDHNGAGTLKGNAHANGYLISSGGGGLLWGEAANPIDVAVCGAAGASFNGGGTIYGTLKAVSLPKGTPTPCTVTLGAVPTIAMPNISAKLTEYYNIALANGQVFSSAPSGGNWGTIPGGVRWFNLPAGFRVNAGVSYVGSVICTGPVEFRGGLTQTRVGDLPALVSRDGGITVRGAHAVQGLVYANGDVEWNGAGTIDGSIIVGGNMRFNGAYGNLAYTYSVPGDAGGSSGSSADLAGVTAWQK